MILTVSNLSKSYGANAALKNFCMTVEKGNVLGVLGPNGGGKTTFLSILMGLRHANSGQFCWFNSQKPCNHRIGALIEAPSLYPYLTVAQNLQTTAIIKGLNTQHIEEALRKVDLAQKRDAKCFTLSLGMKQRLAIAQALIGSPEVLVLDEPTNGLDPVGIADVRNIIKQEATEGITIIIASHNLEEIQKVCSHVVILKDGKNIAYGKVDDLLKLKHIATIESSKIDEIEYMVTRLDNIKVLKKSKSSITIWTSSGEMLAQATTALLQNGIEIAKLEVREPSLEELFLDIIKQN